MADSYSIVGLATPSGTSRNYY